MRVLLEASYLPPSGNTGSHTYVRELATAWKAQHPGDVLGVRLATGARPDDFAGESIIVGPVARHRAPEPDWDVCIWTSPAVVRLPSTMKNVVVFHDLRTLDSTWDDIPPGKALARSFLYKRSHRLADQIIYISERTADECEALFGRPDAPSRVIPHAGDHIRGGLEPQRRRGFVVFAGRPNKRAELAVLAHLALPERIRIEHELLLVAGTEGRASQLRDSLSRLGVTLQNIRVLGPSCTTDIGRLLSSANVLIVLGRGEGFGLPAMEGEASGCVVICSDDVPAVRYLSEPIVVDSDRPLLVEAMRQAIRRSTDNGARTGAPMRSWAQVADETRSFVCAS